MGVLSAIIRESAFPGSVKYTVADIPDMSGKVVLVTGATAGIGKETARVSISSKLSVSRILGRSLCFILK